MPLVLHRGNVPSRSAGGVSSVHQLAPDSARLGPLFSVPTGKHAASHQQFPVKPGGVKVAVGDEVYPRIGYGVRQICGLHVRQPEELSFHSKRVPVLVVQQDLAGKECPV